MLEQIIKLALKYKFLTIALFVAICMLGYKRYIDIPIDAFPDITPKQVVIYTESPGNSPTDIEKLVTYPIESALSGMAGVKSITSNSIFGLSYVSVFFDDNLDIYFLRQLVTERLNSVDIPYGFGKPKLGPNTTGLGQVFWYEIEDSSKKYGLAKIRELQDFIVKPLFKGVSGVEEVVSWGGYEKQYNILIDPKKLQHYNITYDDIINAIEKNNNSAGGSYLEFNKEQYLLRYSSLYKDINDIKNTIISMKNQTATTISDVAEVEISHSPRFGAISIDGDESVIGMVLQRTDTNAAQVVSRLKEKIKTINQTLPKGITIKSIYDRSDITKKAVSTMSGALLSGMILVSVVLFLFLYEFRSAFIVILSLPISLLIAFLFMDYFNMSANLMSLSGLAIAVGMIVDATIVIVENSLRTIDENPKKDKISLIYKASSEVAKPVVFAILIIVAVFIPLLSLDGLAGKLYTPMALNIVFVMLGSLVVALILTPVLSSLLLKRKKDNKNILINSIKKLYSPLLDLSLKHSRSLLVGVSLVSVFLIYLLSNQGREFMPSLNEESIMYRVIAIPGTSLSKSIESASEIEKFILKNYSDVESVLSMIGRSENGETAQANYMEILLSLKPDLKDLPALRDSMNEKLKHHFEYLNFVPTQPIAMRIEELLEGVQSELAIKIYGEDQKILTKIASQIKDLLFKVKGLEHIELESQLGQSSIDIKPNFLALAKYGISSDEVMRVVRYGVGEESVSQKFEGVKRFPIVVKIKDAKKDIQSLKNLTLRSKDGSMVSLEELCNITIKQGASFIKRENLSRYMVLSMDVEDRDIASFVKESKSLIQKELDLPSGYYTKWVGEFKNMNEATKKLQLIIPLTILIILILLYTAFGSIKKASLILLNVPFGMIGGIIALLLADIYLSISAIIGFLAIFAISILNGIVLVSFIDELLEKNQGVKMELIIKQATLLRLRPVLMTAFTTLFGILPLLFASGVGSEIQYPLSVVITGGIISSTILTLLILPSAYRLLFDKS